MKSLQHSLESTLLEILSDESYEGSPEELIAKVKEILPDLSAATAKSMLATIKGEASSGLKAEWELRRRFEERLGEHWQKPLELLDLFIRLCLEAGYNLNDAFRTDAACSNDVLFEALTRFHARACQVASAILVLLRSGYADDAHARWRALHEISVVSQFLSDAGREVAEKYLLHDNVQRYKLALQYQKHAEALNEKPVTQKEIDVLKARRDDLVGRFGKPFEADYGWAASVLEKKRPTIADIEDHMNLEHWRPYYKMASDNVHANAHGAYFRLGLAPNTDEVLLAGPSDAGLAVPGHSTAISLCQITLAMLMTKPDFDGVVIMQILEKLEDEIGEAFLEAHRETERQQ